MEVINRVLIDDRLSNSLLLTSVSIQVHPTLHRHEGWYLLPSAPPVRDGFPEMLHLIDAPWKKAQSEGEQSVPSDQGAHAQLLPSLLPK